MEQNPAIALFLALGLMIAVAKIGGSLARRVGQPRVFGELLAGVLLGPTVLDLLHWGVFAEADVHLLEETIAQLAELGVLLLMFLIGLEVQPHELAAVGRLALLASVMGSFASLLLVALVSLVFGFSTQAALFAGVTLAATSVSISAQTLLELRILRTKEGIALLATALLDDVLTIVMISLLIATTSPEANNSLPVIVVRIAIYILGALAASWFVLPGVVNWIHERSQMLKGTAAFGLMLILFFGWSAEALGGVAAILGAFIAGLGFSRTHEGAKHEVEQAMLNIGYAFLVPIFFINIGLLVNLRQISLDALPFAVLLLLVAVAAKIGGVSLGARLGNFQPHEALRVGVCMVSRGEVSLIVASIALTQGIFNNLLFSSLFLVILLTAILTPPLVRWVFQQKTRTQQETEIATNT